MSNNLRYLSNPYQMSSSRGFMWKEMEILKHLNFRDMENMKCALHKSSPEYFFIFFYHPPPKQIINNQHTSISFLQILSHLQLSITDYNKAFLCLKNDVSSFVQLRSLSLSELLPSYLYPSRLTVQPAYIILTSVGKKSLSIFRLLDLDFRPIYYYY